MAAPSVSNQWHIPSFRPVIQYPKDLILCEGASFGLPLRRKDWKEPLGVTEAEWQVCSEEGKVLSAGID